MQVVKQRRDAALARMAAAVPYARYLGVGFDRRGDELTARARLLGEADRQPAAAGAARRGHRRLPRDHRDHGARLEPGLGADGGRRGGGGGIEAGEFPPLPKTIDFTVDYLRSGLPRDAYARARVNRSGRRYASVHVEAWQDNRARPFAQATGHFLTGRSDG